MSNKNEIIFVLIGSGGGGGGLLKLYIVIHILMYYIIHTVFGVFLKIWKSTEKLFYRKRLQFDSRNVKYE